MIYLAGVRTAASESKRAAQQLLKRTAQELWGFRKLPEIQRTYSGKPYFVKYPGFRFNLSHSGGYALCLFSDEGEVGVDVELIRPHRAGLPEFVMSSEELAAFDGTWEDFTRIWTIKEAYVKYLGCSIHSPKRIPAPPPVPCRTFEGEDWRAAVCARASLPEEIVWCSL